MQCQAAIRESAGAIAVLMREQGITSIKHVFECDEIDHDALCEPGAATTLTVVNARDGQVPPAIRVPHELPMAVPGLAPGQACLRYGRSLVNDVLTAMIGPALHLARQSRDFRDSRVTWGYITLNDRGKVNIKVSQREVGTTELVVQPS